MAIPRQAPGAVPTNVGVYLGKVTRVTGRTCYVELRSLAPGLEYGPARYPATYAAAATTDPDPGDTHSHGLPPLAAGDPVAVAFLEGRRDDVVVLARLA